MNRGVLASLVLVAALAAVAGCSKGSGSASSRYLTEPVAVGDVEKTVLSTGTLQPLLVVNVGAQATGQIQSLKVQLGDTVKKGQLLGVIDPAIQQNTLQNARQPRLRDRLLTSPRRGARQGDASADFGWEAEPGSCGVSPLRASR